MPEDSDFMNVFSFLEMIGNYDDRVVARADFPENDIFVSTAWVNDTQPPYETAICHPRYNKGQLVIVEHYETKELANEGHTKWVQFVLSEDLPPFLRDDGRCPCSLVLSAIGDDGWRRYWLDGVVPPEFK